MLIFENIRDIINIKKNSELTMDFKNWNYCININLSLTENVQQFQHEFQVFLKGVPGPTHLLLA